MKEVRVSKTWDRFKPSTGDYNNYNQFYNTVSGNGLVEFPRKSHNFFKGHEWFVRVDVRRYWKCINYKDKALKEFNYFQSKGVTFPRYNPLHKDFYFDFGGYAFNSNLNKYASFILFLRENMDLDKVNDYCEIGGGYGGMVEMLILNSKIKHYYLIDLKETLGISKVWLKNHDNIIFLESTDYKGKIKNVDLFLNSNSLSEMTEDQVRNYFDFIESFNNCYLFSSNKIKRREDDFVHYAELYPYCKRWSMIAKRFGRDHNLDVLTRL